MGGTPRAGWFILETYIKIDDLGVPIILGNLSLEAEVGTQPQNAPQTAAERQVSPRTLPHRSTRCRSTLGSRGQRSSLAFRVE